MDTKELNITFDNTRYHLNNEMEKWCEKNIGPGCWTFGKARTWEGMGTNLWTIDSMFGNTTFSFKNEKDYIWFVLRWS
jgi:hypothetical protein